MHDYMYTTAFSYNIIVEKIGLVCSKNRCDLKFITRQTA